MVFIKRNILPIIIAVFLITVLAFVEFFYSEIVIFPKSGMQDEGIFVYSDSGNTKVAGFDLGQESITADFYLDTAIKYPHAGINFGLEKAVNENFRVILDISTTNIQNFVIKIWKRQRLQTSDASFPERKLFMYNVSQKKQRESYSIDISRFTTPPWWYRENGFTIGEIDDKNYSEIVSISIESGPYERTTEKSSMTIYNLKFKRSFTEYHILAAMAVLLYLLFTSIRLNRKKIAPVLKKLSPYTSEKSKAIFDLLSLHYQDRDLTIQKVSKTTSFPTDYIEKVISEEYNLSFNMYLNKLRITEAKRLIKETDRHMFEISDIVGFRNVTYFNKIFKVFEKVSPKEYRKLQQEKHPKFYE